MMLSKRFKVYVLLLFACIVIVLLWGNKSISVTEYKIKSSTIPKNFSGFTIVQISDMHNSEFGRKQRIIAEKIIALNPNIVVITGDLVDSNNTDIPTSIDLIRDIKSTAPIYFVPGNHEAWIGEKYKELIAKLKAEGVQVLENNAEILNVGSDSINLMGITDPEFRDSLSALDDVTTVDSRIKSINRDQSLYTVLLSHRPEVFDTYALNQIDLIFTGHAHGGQFRLPFIGGLIAPNQGLFPRYDEGLYVRDKTKMIVSRGLGNSIIPLRINNRPELVVVKLMPE